MKRVLVYTLFALATVSGTVAQANNQGASATRCSLGVAQAPEIRGFRLGTRWEQVVARFPGLLKEAAQAREVELLFVEGKSRVVSQSGRDSLAFFNRSKFAGFEQIFGLDLRFSGGDIARIEVKYDGSTKWNTTEEFANKISEALGLPGDWRADVSSRGRRFLECDGFRVTVSFESSCTTPPFCGQPNESALLPVLRLEDTTADARGLEKLRKENDEKERREEQKRKVFKP